ncbi:MAG: hypothetical protein WCJ01_08890 [Ignavibacteria bacterium]
MRAKKNVSGEEKLSFSIFTDGYYLLPEINLVHFNTVRGLCHSFQSNSDRRETAIPVKQNKPDGKYIAGSNAGGLPGSIYIYKLTAESYPGIKKLSLLKFRKIILIEMIFFQIQSKPQTNLDHYLMKSGVLG